MIPDQNILTFSHDRADPLETVVTLLRKHNNEDYYVYEREEVWHLGLGARATLVVDPQGKTVTISGDGKRECHQVTGSLADAARDFVSKRSHHGCKVYGHVGFNYAAHIRHQTYTPGQWPLLCLMEPSIEVVLDRNLVTVTGSDAERRLALLELLKPDYSISHFDPPHFAYVDTSRNGEDYTAGVAKALAEIAKGQYTKVILSRAVELDHTIDMPTTLLWGRRANTPARTFSFRHEGQEAISFSPELVMSLENGKLFTEPLAGTRSAAGPDSEAEERRKELLSDPKEIVEHVISVRAAVDELNALCQPGTVTVEDLISVRQRGSVMHLGSHVSGSIVPDKDGWDAFNELFPSITASGIPKDAAIAAIERLESQPRELYSGAILVLDGTTSFEATLVLRTVFQNPSRSWIQAGAGIIALSDPQRKLTETREKLASIAPFLVVPGEPETSAETAAWLRLNHSRRCL